MNIQDYISSGIVEAYVLGLADEAERADFEVMCTKYPEVQAARESFEILIEQNALSNALSAPVQLKDKIFNAIKEEKGQSAAPVVPFSTPVNKPSVQRVIGFNRYLSAAAIILLVASTVLNFYFYRQYKTYSERYAGLLESQQQLVNSSNTLNVRLQAYESAMDLMKSPDIAVVQMPASTVPTSPDPNSLAIVYWNTRTKDVYLLFNQMPQAGPGQQYQLWAIVDGKPVDAGLVASNGENLLIKMKNIPDADAFAVTLEKSGGSTSPQGQMYVLGNVKT